MKQIAFDFSLRPEPTLENFIVGRNAELLHNMRRLLSTHTLERAIYLWGASGSGRTHLLQGFVNTARAERFHSRRVQRADRGDRYKD